jgi:outer membrane lipoprotein SlyB
METQTNKSPHTLFWIAGIAVTVFSAAGIAAIMGWIPTSTSSPTQSVMAMPAPPAKVAAAPAKTQAQIQAEAQARDQARNEARADARDQARSEARADARDEARDQARAQRAQAQAAKARCAECGVIESIREVATKGEGSGIGAVGGAVVGGVLGNQVGGGTGKTIATVAGAVGGAVAGNEIEKHVKSSKSYDVTVRFEDGSSRVVHEAKATTWRTGDRVKVVNGIIQSNG